jgi:hypothetical protein
MPIELNNKVVIDDNRNLLNVVSASFTSNSYIKLTDGTTEQRPNLPENGMVRYNSEKKVFEGYSNTSWTLIGDSVDIIETPKNISPSVDQTGVSNTNIFLQASTYYHVYDKPKANAQWQISDTTSFNTTLVDQVVSGTAITYTTSVNIQGQHLHWRVRYQDSDGLWSKWSNSTRFYVTGAPLAPTTLGESYQGGYYAGVINIGNDVCYYVVLAPMATGSACCVWKTTNTVTGNTGSATNGYLNTYTALNNTTHPAGNFTATRTISGYSDWYLPSRNELPLMSRVESSLPAGEKSIVSSPCTTTYWGSTEISNYAYRITIPSCFPAVGSKIQSWGVRAVRRIPV